MRLGKVTIQNKEIAIASLSIDQAEARINSAPPEGMEAEAQVEYYKARMYSTVVDGLNNAIIEWDGARSFVPDGVPLYTADIVRKRFDYDEAAELQGEILSLSKLRVLSTVGETKAAPAEQTSPTSAAA